MKLAFAALVLPIAASLAFGGEVAVVAGGGTGGDGSKATEAKLVQPFAVDFAKDGTAYFVEMNGGERLRTIDAEGRVQTLAGTGKKGQPEAKVAAAKAKFDGMHNLVVLDDGILLADTFNHCIRRYDFESKSVVRLFGTGKVGFAGDGDDIEKVQFAQPICIAVSTDRKLLFVTDIGNKRVRSTPFASPKFTTIAGNGKSGVPKDGAVAATSTLFDPRAVAIGPKGEIYILERGGHALRVVDAEGKIRTVAGTGKKGNSGDGGEALKATFDGPKFLAVDRDGSVLIADTENHRIRRYVPKTGKVEAVAGSGKKGNGFDTDPAKLELSRPHGVSVHPKTGDIWIADSDNGRLLKISAER